WVVLLLVALCISQHAFSQGAVLQSGSVKSGHVTTWAGNGTVKDGGGAAYGALTELGITAVGKPLPFCINDAPSRGPYHAWCLSPNFSGNGYFSYNALNGAVAQPLKFNVNGVDYPFPFAANGNVTGPSTSVINDIAVFANTLGTQIADTGIKAPFNPVLHPST